MGVTNTMGQSHSLLCRNHIYDEIDLNNKTRLGQRKDSVVTLDIKINDLDKNNKNERVEREKTEWYPPPSQSQEQESWLEDRGWEQQRSRRREDILYNIFMFESQETATNNIDFIRKRSSEPKYGRLASLDVTSLDQQYKDNYTNF